MERNNTYDFSQDVDDFDELSSEEKLDLIAGFFHEQIDEIVIQLKELTLVDEDLLPYNLLRRIILMSIDVYGFELISNAVDKFLDEALSCAEQVVQ